MSAIDKLPLAIPPRDRFVRAIAEKLDPARIVEMHLFAPMRQGGVETGVAVLAAEMPVEPQAGLDPTDAGRRTQDAGGPRAEDSDARRTTHDSRHTVFTAWYRLTLKGAERGKWEFNIADEAVAPLDTIMRVARGVGERAGDADDPERWTGDHFRTALTEAAGG